MTKTALILATAGTLALGSIGAPAPAQARVWGWGVGPAVAGGLLAGAVIGGLASSTYGWGPYGYYGGYAPAYAWGAPGWGWGGPVYAWGGPAYYNTYAYDYPAYGYAPRYTYGYRRVFRPAYAFYRGPRFYHRWHHAWYRRW